MAIKPLLCPSSVYGISYVFKIMYKNVVFNLLYIVQMGVILQIDLFTRLNDRYIPKSTDFF